MGSGRLGEVRLGEVGSVGRGQVECRVKSDWAKLCRVGRGQVGSGHVIVRQIKTQLVGRKTQSQ